MGGAGTYEVVTTGTPKPVRQRRTAAIYIAAVAVGTASAAISGIESGHVELAVLVVIGVAVAYALGRWFIGPASPHLTLDPDEYELVDALLARGSGLANADLRAALAGGRMSRAQLGRLRDVVHAEAERLDALVDDKTAPHEMVDAWFFLTSIERRLAKLT